MRVGVVALNLSFSRGLGGHLDVGPPLCLARCVLWSEFGLCLSDFGAHAVFHGSYLSASFICSKPSQSKLLRAVYKHDFSHMHMTGKISMPTLHADHGQRSPLWAL